MPKLILVKTESGDVPGLLVPAMAVQYDGASDSVVVRDLITVDNSAVDTIPKTLCFEFDDATMTLNNALITSAEVMTKAAAMKLDAAKMLTDLLLQPAVFNVEGGATPFLGH